MRAFVAVEVTNPAIRDNIRALQARLVTPAESKSVKMVDADILHFTLQFLGNIADSEAARVANALSSVRFEPFDLKVAKVGAFPSMRSPRIIWVGGETAPDKSRDETADSITGLQNLAQKVSHVLGPMGYTRDKPFKAHSTIFRVKNKGVDIADRLREKSDAVFGIHRVENFKLKKSILTPKGPVYTDLAVITSEAGSK